MQQDLGVSFLRLAPYLVTLQENKKENQFAVWGVRFPKQDAVADWACLLAPSKLV